MTTGSAPIVVKLGGSLLEGDALPAWLDTLAREGAGCAVVVPGGGPFAQAVRDTQHALRFGDAAAHRMALLAMDQFGILLCGLAPGLHPARNPAEIRALLARRAVPVWLPASALEAGVAGIAESWDLTSDSLAAWLAGQLGARQLVLVKSAHPPSADHRELARAGFVDAAFPAFAAACDASVDILGPGQQHRLRDMLRGIAAQCSPVSQG